jgi:hypothetical protein
MKYRLEGTTIEAIDTYVRVTVGEKAEVTASQYPAPAEVAWLLQRMQGYPPNSAQLSACSRAAYDAENNKIELAPREKDRWTTKCTR